MEEILLEKFERGGKINKLKFDISVPKVIGDNYYLKIGYRQQSTYTIVRDKMKNNRSCSDETSLILIRTSKYK